MDGCNEVCSGAWDGNTAKHIEEDLIPKILAYAGEIGYDWYSVFRESCCRPNTFTNQHTNNQKIMEYFSPDSIRSCGE